jgi:hypothetical protein
MGRVTIALLLTSTVLLLVAFTKGISLVRGGHDVLSHLYWAMAALIGALAANVFAIFHAAQSDRIIRELRATLETALPKEPGTQRAPFDTAPERPVLSAVEGMGPTQGER